MEEIKTKVCSKCHIEKPLTEFGKNKNNKDGMQNWCKKCKREYKYNKNSRKMRLQPKDGFKICYTCKKEKPKSEFNKNRCHSDGLNSNCRECIKNNNGLPENIEYRKQYREKNSEIISIKKSEYYYKNIEKISIKNSMYRSTHKEEKRKYDREYVKRDPEYQRIRRLVYRLTHREELLQYWRDYNKNHKEEKREYNIKYLQEHKKEIHDRVVEYRKTPEGAASVSRGHNNRRYRTKNAKNTLTAKQWDKILEMQNYICPLCERSFSNDLPPTKDHIIPAYLGWGLTFGNTQALCQSCNSKKHIKVEFMRGIYTLLVTDI
jgi:hypothetical protein